MQKIRIKLKSYDHNLIDKSAEKIIRTVKQTGAIVSGPVPLPTEKTVYTDGQAYTEQASDMTAIEPSLSYTNTAASMAATGNIVYIKVYGTPATTLVVGAQSGSGKCFWVRDTTGAPGTQYLQTSSPCSGSVPNDTTAMTSSW